MKRVRLTIEWPGACSELDWIDRLVEALEEFDTSGQSRVVKAERLTCEGTTEVLPPKPRGFWATMFDRLPRSPFPWGMP